MYKRKYGKFFCKSRIWGVICMKISRAKIESYEFKSKKNKYYEAQAVDSALMEIADDVEGIHLKSHGTNSGEGNEELRAVRQKALRNARKSI